MCSDMSCGCLVGLPFKDSKEDNNACVVDASSLMI